MQDHFVDRESETFTKNKLLPSFETPIIVRRGNNLSVFWLYISLLWLQLTHLMDL